MFDPHVTFGWYMHRFQDEYTHSGFCNIYHMVERSTADISDPRRHIHRDVKHQAKYAAEVGYRGYGPPYHTIYNISYG